MSEANYAVGNATAEFQSVRNWKFGVRTLADSAIEARNWHFVSFVIRHSAFNMPTALAKGNGNGGNAKGDLSILGQESHATTWRLARMKEVHGNQR